MVVGIVERHLIVKPVQPGKVTVIVHRGVCRRDGGEAVMIGRGRSLECQRLGGIGEMQLGRIHRGSGSEPQALQVNVAAHTTVRRRRSETTADINVQSVGFQLGQHVMIPMVPRRGGHASEMVPAHPWKTV